MTRNVLDCSTYSVRDHTTTSDVIVILSVAKSPEVEPAVQSLKDAGLQVVAIDCENGIVEGYLDSNKIEGLRTLPKIDYVRPLFAFDGQTPGC